MMPRLLYARVKFLLSETSFGSQRLEFEKTVRAVLRRCST